VTIANTNAQIENNQNLASDTRANYVRITNFIAKCLKATNMQKLINQPEKVINYIVNCYPNMNSRTGYLVAFVFLIKHTTLQVTDVVQQKFYDAMVQSASAAQEIAKDNAPKVATIMLNGKPIQWKDVLECEKAIAQGRVRKSRPSAGCYVHTHTASKTQIFFVKWRYSRVKQSSTIQRSLRILETSL
jgi:hypothetical protein